MISSFKLNKINILLKSGYTQTIITNSEKLICKLSTKIAVVDDGVDKELTRTIDRITQIKRKDIKKKPQKPPFAKNIFLGVFDTDILTYPEALDKNTVDELEKDILPVRDFFNNIDDRREKRITSEYLSNLNKLKLIGLQASTFDDGRQLTLTEACRYLEEMSANSSRIGVVESEQLGIQILIKHGNEKHRKYLEQLISGKSVISFCVSEGKASNAELMDTKARLSNDKKSWVINGTKKLIINGDSADLFIVFAEIEKPKERGKSEKAINAFIVERSFGGITSRPCEVTGLDQTDISNVTFENTVVPSDNLIGEVNESNKLISSTLAEYRIGKGAVLTALLKNAINKFVNHCIDIDGGLNNILQADAVQSKIGDLTAKLYAIESVTYLTAGLLDQYENQDCDLEAAIVKMVSASYTHDSIIKIMDFMGSIAYSKNNWCNRFYHDSLGHVLLNEPVDSLKLTIALLGLQHAGVNLANTVRVLRNPLYHPATILKRMWTHKRHMEDNPKLTLGLHQYLHPTAATAAQNLEYSVLRLQFATETVLARYGSEIVNKHVVLQRLSECIADIYVSTAVLGRASRSYCIGLRHANIEMQIAAAFAAGTMARVKDNVKKIWQGPYNTSDETKLEIGKYAITQKGYFPEHPLTRNF